METEDFISQMLVDIKRLEHVRDTAAREIKMLQKLVKRGTGK